MATEGVVFFSRCRPQGSNPIDLVVRERCVFIGYPAWRANVVPKKGHLRDAVIDLQCPDEEWKAHYAGFDVNRGQYQKNRNFVQSIKRGAIALVPRPDRGAVYAGRVVQPFELLDDPPWADEYLRLRRSQRQAIAEEFNHIADVAQCCMVDRFRELPFSTVPAWIRQSLFGRSTYGLIRKLQPLSLNPYDPYEELDKLIDSPDQAESSWTNDIRVVEHRLVNAVGPHIFEHLCVALLQLEHPEQIWAHVGGSGDGGVDGIGSGPDGRAIALLQCKWNYSGEDVPIADPAYRSVVRQLLSALIHADGVRKPQGVEFWSLREIALLVIKHAHRLPLATSLRVSNGMLRRS